MTLTEFLLARIAEDEAAARDAGERRGLPYESPLYVVDDNYRHDQCGTCAGALPNCDLSVHVPAC